MVAVKNEDPMPDHEVEVVGRAEEEASDRRVGATIMEAATVVGKVNDHASAAAAVGN